MAFVKTKDNVELYFEDHGQGEVIVFVSGFMGIKNIWHKQVETFKRTNRVITYDNRGYGSSSRPEAANLYSVEHHAEDLTSILSAAGVSEPVVLVTHSMGGNIGTEFTLKYPEKVRAIIYTGAYASGSQLNRNGVTAKTLFAAVATPQTSMQFFKALGLTEDVALEAAKWATYALQYNAEALERYNCEDRYVELEKPVLIIQGGVDFATPVVPYATELQSAISGALLEVLDNINHFPQMEAPEKFSRSIKLFMQRLA